jgi:hypothetical protein
VFNHVQLEIESANISIRLRPDSASIPVLSGQIRQNSLSEVPSAGLTWRSKLYAVVPVLQRFLLKLNFAIEHDAHWSKALVRIDT